MNRFQPKEPVGKRIRILFIEDDRIDQMAFERFVQESELDYDYKLAGSLSEARNALEAAEFDVIITDYSLGDGNAFALFENHYDIPVILATGAGNEEIAVKALKAGAFDYLIKDPDRQYLKILPVTVENAVRRHQAYRQNQLLSHAIMHTQDSVFMTNLEGEIIFVNQAFCKTYGYEPEEILGKSSRTLWKASANKRRRGISSAAAKGEALHLRQDGTMFPVFYSQSTVNDAHDKPVARMVVVRDVSELKEAEMALKESEERYRRLVERTPDAIAILNDGEIVFTNMAGVRFFGGKSVKQVLKHSIWDFVHPDSKEDFSNLLKEVSQKNDSAPLIEIKFVQLGKSEIFGECLAIPFAMDHQKSVQLVIRDITRRKLAEKELRRSEAQLRQSQKMEAVGRLAGGIAHDFNNLLMVIKGYSELLLDELQEDEVLREHVEEIQNAGQMAASMTRQLLALSRQQMLKSKLIDLNEVIRHMRRLLGRLIGENVEFLLKLDSHIPQIKADPGQMEQVIMNLVVNARDAMPGGGTLSIETRAMEVKSDYITGGESISPGYYLLLAVSDSGCGMNAEIKEHLFEPFFTTKDVGQGTGLGLSTVYSIVKQSGGHIWVYSEEGKGTTVKIYFPAAEGQVKTDKKGRLTMPLPRGTETVLLVEDETPVRNLVQKVLNKHGYTVLNARDGEEALTICRDFDSQIDILITDVVMPGINGARLAELVQEARPEVKVLFMSGYTENLVVQDQILDSHSEFLQKPFPPETLLKKVRAMLDLSPQKHPDSLKN